jgi:hypothetical protein
MAILSISLTDAEAQSKFIFKLCMCKVEVAAAIQIFHQPLVCAISRAQPEANQIKFAWSGQLKARVSAYPFRELLRQSDVLANVILQSLEPIMPQHEP